MAERDNEKALTEHQRKLRYASTRKPVYEQDKDAAELMAEERRNRLENDPFVRRQRALEAIEQRRELERKPPTHAHDEALKHFDTRFADIIADPVLRVRAHQGYHQISRRAAASGQPVDWHSEVTKMGNELRKSVGRMTAEEAERAEALAEMVRSRKPE